MKKILSIVLTAAMLCTTAFTLSACGGSSAKKVASIDDLKGAKIGVQLGTTGDTTLPITRKRVQKLSAITRALMLFLL